MSNEVLPTFLVEARELSEEIEIALLMCERGTADSDTINALFRAAHTIKGSAGLFGLDNIVAFVHVVETVLDRVRNGKQEMTPAPAQALIGCRDHINSLLDAVSNGNNDDAPALASAGGLLWSRCSISRHASTAAAMP